MSEYKKNIRPLSSTGGFSLIELLVALAITGVLMAGILQVFRASISSFSTMHETLGIQRNARFGLQLIQEDVLQAGYLLPPRTVTGLGAQPAILMQQTNGDAIYTPTGVSAPVDEIQFIMDLPLGLEGTLINASLENAVKIEVAFPSSASRLKAGDLAIFLDGKMDIAMIKGPPDSVGKIELNTSNLFDEFGNIPVSMIQPNLRFPHAKTAQVTFVRPLQVVRYTVVPRKLDPSSDTAVVPCLVRQSKSLDTSTLWQPKATEIPADEAVLIEDVTGFSLDWSLDGGQTWIRSKTVNTWGEVKAALVTAAGKLVSPVATQMVAAGGLDNPKDAFWFNYTPLLIRVDVEARTRVQRSEYSKKGDELSYRTRRETLFLSPRNFALGQP